LQPGWSSARLSYSVNGRSVGLTVRLVTTQPNYGGVRWWFVCPLTTRGQACNRRVMKLYLPPNGHYFGCRHCYDLTYRSRQQSDKRVAWLRRNPEAISR